MSIDIAATGDQLGECPLWHPDEGLLYWVDIEGRLLRRLDPGSGDVESRSLPGRPGSFVRSERPGRVLAGIETTLVWYDWETDSITPWFEVEPAGTGNRLNDGRTDSVGRYWVGSMFERPSEERFAGWLHRVEADGSFLTPRGEVGVSNGLAFDPERNRMYWADSLHDAVWRYDYDLETGEAQNETLFIDFSDRPGRPDGACVDAEGCYWVAAVYGWAVMRFTPDGVLDRTIELPIEAPTMPAFGGADLDTLFVTSIGAGASRSLSPSEAPPGSLLVIDAGVVGRIDPPFAG